MVEPQPKQPFPRPFYVANVLELLERFGHYGMYIGLSIYLTSVVKMNDAQTGDTLGNFRFVGSLSPIVCGAIADRITFRRSFLLAFTLYAFAYASLYFYPSIFMAPVALTAAGFAGGFLKPVVLGTVRRTSPEGRQREGFAIFYRMVNAGSVFGKTLAYGTRALFSLRHVMVNSVVASITALVVAFTLFREPADATAASEAETEQKRDAGNVMEVLRGYAGAFTNGRLVTILLLMSAYYFMIEQFYMTFPKYVVRHIDPKAPLEIITLVNPALIATFGSRVARITAPLRPLTTMTLGTLIGGLSMLVMGIVPGIPGALLSAAVFSLAEMVFSPRFLDTIAGFAPPGKAALYMGLTFVPQAIGSFIGGRVSGRLIAMWLPEQGARFPLYIWGSYAAFGGLAGVLMFGVAKLFLKDPPAAAA